MENTDICNTSQSSNVVWWCYW